MCDCIDYSVITVVRRGAVPSTVRHRNCECVDVRRRAAPYGTASGVK